MDRSTPPEPALIELTPLDALVIALGLDPKVRERVVATRFGASIEDWALERQRAPGVCYALVDPHLGPIAMGGVSLDFPGVGRAWFAMLPAARARRRAILFHCKRVLRAVIDSGLCHRIEANTRTADRASAAVLAKHVGFVYEYTRPMGDYDRTHFDVWAMLGDPDAPLAG